jgi:hypothetical protein
MWTIWFLLWVRMAQRYFVPFRFIPSLDLGSFRGGGVLRGAPLALGGLGCSYSRWKLHAAGRSETPGFGLRNTDFRREVEHGPPGCSNLAIRGANVVLYDRGLTAWSFFVEDSYGGPDLRVSPIAPIHRGSGLAPLGATGRATTYSATFVEGTESLCRTGRCCIHVEHSLALQEGTVGEVCTGENLTVAENS